jgi:hypothetical protein
MQYHVLRNVLVRNASVVLITEEELNDLPERLIVFHTGPAGGSDPLSVDLHSETALAGGVTPFAACAFP